MVRGLPALGRPCLHACPVSDYCFECGADLPGDHLRWCATYAPQPIDRTAPTRRDYDWETPDPGKLAHRNDPQTAKDAARRTDAATGREAVHTALLRHGPMTADELERLDLNLGNVPRIAARRLSDLKQAGRVVATGERRRTQSGSLADVYRAI
jgi:hypothetical protein